MTMIHDHKITPNGASPVSNGTGRTAWQVIDDACQMGVTGELALTTSSPTKTKVYLMNGLVYFAEHDTDESLATRLVQVGALDARQMQHGLMMINGAEHLGRMFERDNTIDRDAVEVAIEAITEETLTTIAELPVISFRTTMYRHHPGGIHRWYSSQLSAEAEVGGSSMAPLVTIVPVSDTSAAAVAVATPAPAPVVEAPALVAPAAAHTQAPQPLSQPASLAPPAAAIFQAPTLPAPTPEPAIAEPIAIEPMFIEPAFVEPVFIEPVFVEPVPAEPATLVPMVLEPVVPEPNVPAAVEPAPSPPIQSRHPEIIELATLLASPSMSVPEPLLLEPEPSREDVWADLWAAAGAAQDSAPDIAPTVDAETERVAVPDAETETVRPVALDSGFWTEFDAGPSLASPDHLPTAQSTAPESAGTETLDPMTLTLTTPWAAPQPAVDAPPSPSAEPAAAETPSPMPVLPIYSSPPVMRIPQQSTTPRSVLSNAAPAIELDPNGPHLPTTAATEDALPVADAPAPTSATLQTLTPMAAPPSMTPLTSLASLAPMTPFASLDSPTPLATVAPLAAPAALQPLAPTPPPAATTPGAPAMPMMPAVEPTPAPNHLIPALGATPVPADVAAAVRRAINAIEAATLGTGQGAVSFGAMRVTAPGTAAAAPVDIPSAPTPAIPATQPQAPVLQAPAPQPLVATLPSLPTPGLTPLAAQLPTLPSPAPLPTLENPTGPNNITVIQAGNGAVSPLMSLNGPGARHGLSGTDFAPPVTGVPNGGPHLPEAATKPAADATPERRSALRRLIAGIRKR